MNAKIILLTLFSFMPVRDNVVNAWEACCGKCVGSGYCTACTSCNYCKHCNSGGSCGVCRSSSMSGSSSNSSSSSSSGSNGSSERNSGRGLEYGSTNNSFYSPGSAPKKRMKKQQQEQYYVNRKYLHVRTGPGEKYTIIDKLNYGTHVYLQGVYTNGWCLIHYYGADLTLKSGYVLRAYIDHYTI
ncbi:SH3 domain-containing protein [Chitinophaga nivalis]|uniref:SH3 domain-containing protein n=1 Tax=Chitinophaga nivalis TaxID=2991709 RepID=A0ABT3IRF5_9BACT|nr:SH3 domain-containing protein [Chitinophaga nivalis]MCW3464016.1 SH3 domain-containing protein [Chitinophaga nivalis]MCW3486294.1 SH3 domain-containing protein [Chitinophaga nivalis]